MFSPKKIKSIGFKNQQSKQKVYHGLDFWSFFFFSFSVSSCFFQFLPCFPLFSSRLFFKFTTRSLALIALALFWLKLVGMLGLKMTQMTPKKILNKKYSYITVYEKILKHLRKIFSFLNGNLLTNVRAQYDNKGPVSHIIYFPFYIIV